MDSLTDLATFLKEYPGMSLSPFKGGELALSGKFEFIATYNGKPSIRDSYQLEVNIPQKFPMELPSIYEIGEKIPRDGNHHINPDDTLCLGSPLRMRWKMSNSPSLCIFAQKCLIPYLYSISHKLKYGTYPFGELEHGKAGIISDYLELFGLKSDEQVIHSIAMLGIKKRRANKKSCPCNCGKRLGACEFHHKLNAFRKVAPRSWYKYHIEKMGSDK